MLLILLDCVIIFWSNRDPNFPEDSLIILPSNNFLTFPPQSVRSDDVNPRKSFPLMAISFRRCNANGI